MRTENSSEVITKKKQQIIDATKVLFRDKDFDEITMSAIASATHVAKGTIFNYFKTKESIFLTILMEEYQRFIDLFAQKLEHETIKNKSTLKKLILETTASIWDDPNLYLFRLDASLAMLEQTSDVELVAKVKSHMYETTQKLDAYIHNYVENAENISIVSIMFTVNALLIGYSNLVSSQKMQNLLQKYELNDYQLNAKAETLASLDFFLNGYLKTSSK
ncbi:TetR/AcrR family transcriptional regulator [Pediococcus claussenii]|uniref:Transcriptional regulator, TetR family n=1 Tax=Pediococcus claussenii (strain ATCC BAA-344 / DSM 14800 / JCM 18046 / KCTC 3811 / LMG 21948 / P06) TaxID=701521 RepID=G8PBS3_PEDCP|nr:TetR/AcrR family transcriptional regulator [Pediococcus claussenii]AEV95981.1 Transcriptional regulator, TetR family [Pediococcus claussenii ATCC BAA-344]ANZ69467.1 hypothetical protein AYR57_03710 [Pediococcus claussenii]ANZ71287.1 hypothetical protein AYR58_03725 [Pediococcus claussenii]KRN20587.1 hypothetical protein IV79_GL000646 [Pediococcus claussenii]